MARVEYDETGATSYYFVMTILALVLVPVSIGRVARLWNRTAAAQGGGADSSSASYEGVNDEQAKRKLRLLQQRARPSWRWLSAGNVALVAGWALLLLLYYGASRAGAEQQAWDPYAVLGLPPSADAKEVRRVYRELSKTAHPDKGGDEAAFVEITKAYQTLTDPDTRANWELYGNPDGPSARSWGIALPSWLVNAEHQRVVVGAYVFVLLAVLPLCIYCWRSRSAKMTAGHVHVRTEELYARCIKENCSMPHFVDVLAVAEEFATEVPLRRKDYEASRELAQRLPRHLDVQTFNIPPILKARALLYAYLCRVVDDLPPALQGDLTIMLARVPLLINTMLRMYFMRERVRAFRAAQANKSYDPPLLPTVEKFMQYGQCMIQATWSDSIPPLTPLPHMTSAEVAQCKKQLQASSNPVLQLAALDDARRRALLRGLSDDQYHDVVAVLGLYPVILMDCQCKVRMFGAEEVAIATNAVVTIDCKLERVAATEAGAIQRQKTVIAGVADEAVDAAAAAAAEKVDAKFKRVRRGKRVMLVPVRAPTQPQSAGSAEVPSGDRGGESAHESDGEAESDSEATEARGGEPEANGQQQEEDAAWEAVKKQRREKMKLLVEDRTNQSRPVYCPRYPHDKQEWWWLYIVDARKQKLITEPMYIQDLRDEKTVEIKVQAPPEPGKYRFIIRIVSDAYVNCKYEQELVIQVSKAAPEDDARQRDGEDGNGDEDDGDGRRDRGRVGSDDLARAGDESGEDEVLEEDQELNWSDDDKAD